MNRAKQESPRARSRQSGPSFVVRPKSSTRKGRTDVVVHSARQPLQDRSKQKFERVISATIELLQVANIEDISLYDIARQGKLSPASVAYLFPTMSAVHIELSKRFNLLCLEGAREVARRLIRIKNLTWQGWMQVASEQMRDLFNSNRPFSEIALGPLLHRQARLQNIRSVDAVGHVTIEALDKVFVMPQMPNAAFHFALLSEMVDALWSRSYILRGRIDGAEFDESVRVQISYLRSFLPEVLPRRRPDARRAVG